MLKSKNFSDLNKALFIQEMLLAVAGMSSSILPDQARSCLVSIFFARSCLVSTFFLQNRHCSNFVYI